MDARPYAQEHDGPMRRLTKVPETSQECTEAISLFIDRYEILDTVVLNRFITWHGWSQALSIQGTNVEGACLDRPVENHSNFLKRLKPVDLTFEQIRHVKFSVSPEE